MPQDSSLENNVNTGLVLVYDDHPPTAQEIARFLSEHNIPAIAEAGYDPRNAIARHQPNTLLLDRNLGPHDASTFLPTLQKYYPTMRVILMATNPAYETWHDQKGNTIPPPQTLIGKAAFSYENPTPLLALLNKTTPTAPDSTTPSCNK